MCSLEVGWVGSITDFVCRQETGRRHHRGKAIGSWNSPQNEWLKTYIYWSGFVETYFTYKGSHSGLMGLVILPLQDFDCEIVLAVYVKTTM